MIHRIIGVVGLYQNGYVVQTINFKTRNLVHANASHAVKKFINEGIDEILILDLSQNSLNKSMVEKIILEILSECFIPVIYGGHLNDLDFIDKLFRLGVDRILLNNELLKENNIGTELISKYGSQALLACIDTNEFSLEEICFSKRNQKIEKNVKQQIEYLSSINVTEIMFNSPIKDGLREGYAVNNKTIDLIKFCEGKCISTIFMGGAWEKDDFLLAANLGVSGLAAANCFHYKEAFPFVVKKHLLKNNCKVVY